MLEKLTEVLLPIAEKMSSNRYLTAIRNGFLSVMPLVIVASLFTLINSVLLGEGNYLDQWFGLPLTDLTKLGAAISSGTMSVLGVLLAFTVAKSLAEHYEMDTSITGATSVACFLVLTPFATDETLGEIVRTYYLGTAGMFMSFMVAIVSCEAIRFFSNFKALIIKMPDSVPEGIARSFNSLIPIILTVLCFGIVRMITEAAGAPLNDLIFNLIQTPATAIVTSPVGLVIIYILYMLLWGFGIHTAFVFGPVLEPIYLANLSANVAALDAGGTATAIITKPFLDSMAFMGGAGNMLALVIAIFLFSKRDDYRTIGKIGAVPALFNISEPLMFGLPVVMNPILIIPMILSTLAGMGLGALATVAHIMPVTYIMTPWTTPPVLGAFLATGSSFAAGAVALVVLVVSVLIYAPFVIVMNRDKAEVGELADDAEA